MLGVEGFGNDATGAGRELCALPSFMKRLSEPLSKSVADSKDFSLGHRSASIDIWETVDQPCAHALEGLGVADYSRCNDMPRRKQ